MDEKALIKGTIFLLCLLMVVPAGMAADLEGKVIGVLDGDTIDVLHEKKTERIRLYGIRLPGEGAAFRSEGQASYFGTPLRQGCENRDARAG